MAYPKAATTSKKCNYVLPHSIDGEYKKIVVYNAMHEGGISAKAVQKAEGELALEFAAHYTVDDLDGDLWQITDVSEFTMRKSSRSLARIRMEE